MEFVPQAKGIPIFVEEFVPQAKGIPIFVDELGFQVQGPRHCFGTLKNGPGDQVYANGPKSSRKHPKSDHFPRARRQPPETWFLGSRQGLSQEAFQKRENTTRNSQKQPASKRDTYFRRGIRAPSYRNTYFRRRIRLPSPGPQAFSRRIGLYSSRTSWPKL